MKKVLTKEFFNRPAPRVAKDLLGKFLVRRFRGKEDAWMITETEAYEGFEDKASQAHRGKTARNEVMFRDAGTIYVYLTYGMHYMLNIVTGKKDYPSAVLIRGVEDISGPGRLTKGLYITRALNTLYLGEKSGLWIEDRGIQIPRSRISKTPRIGIRSAEEWTDTLYRFVIKDQKKR